MAPDHLDRLGQPLQPRVADDQLERDVGLDRDLHVDAQQVDVDRLAADGMALNVLDQDVGVRAAVDGDAGALPGLSADFEALRWFVLPPECLAGVAPDADRRATGIGSPATGGS